MCVRESINLCVGVGVGVGVCVRVCVCVCLCVCVYQKSSEGTLFSSAQQQSIMEFMMNGFTTTSGRVVVVVSIRTGEPAYTICR